MRTKKRKPHAVTSWPDDPDSPLLTCEGTAARPGCGREFRAVARHPDGRRCGRDRCPHCKAPRRVPDDLHPLYAKWSGLVTRAALDAVRRGWDFQDAYDAAHDAYVVALLRWQPEVSQFSTFAVSTIQYALRQRRPRRHDRRLYTFSDHANERNRPAHFTEIGADDRVRDFATAPATEEADWSELTAAMARLPPQDARVLRLRFGFDGGPPRTLDQIAQEFGFTKERARQIEARGLGRLRETLNLSWLTDPRPLNRS